MEGPWGPSWRVPGVCLEVLRVRLEVLKVRLEVCLEVCLEAVWRLSGAVWSL